jgi:cob(I)alamin adenosyltransferase
MSRISSSYTEGLSNGDLGFSNLLVGDTISKGSHFSSVYSSIEWLQHRLQNISYNEPSFVDNFPRDAAFISWLYEALYSLSSFCYLKGITDVNYGHVPPQESIEFLKTRISELKDLEENLTGKKAESDFVTLSGSLNTIRLSVRDVERHFVGWFHNERVITHEIAKNPEILEGIYRYETFLNRLSSYFYWLSRVYIIKNTGVQALKPWNAKIPPFNV